MGWVSKAFYTYGRFISWYPWLGIIIYIGITGGLSVGLVWLNLDSSPDSLWVNPNSKITKQEKKYEQAYGGYYRIENMIFALSSDESVTMEGNGTNSDAGIFEKQYLREIYYLQNAIMRKTFYFNQTFPNASLNDVCEIAVPDSTECTIPSAIGYWQNNLTRLMNDDAIQLTVQCLYSIDPDNTIPCTDQTGFPILSNEVFGGLQCQSGQVKTACNSCNITVDAFVVSFLVEQHGDEGQGLNKLAAAWEEEVFISLIQQYNNGTFNVSEYLPELGPNPPRAEKNLTVYYMAQRSVSDELNKETIQNIWVIFLSYSLMFIYIILTIGYFPTKMHTGYWLAVVGITLVGTSVITGYGCLGYVGIGGSLISVEVIPFLILAIGVDNMFILTSAVNRKRDVFPLERRIGESIKEVGPSITTAALCEIMAFMVGNFTGVPALTSFCAVACFAVGIDYIFQMTTFLSAIIIDEKRKARQLCDPIVCLRLQESEEPRKEIMLTVFESFVSKVVVSWPCSIVSIAIALGLWGASIYGYSQLELGLDQMTTVSIGSDLYKYFKAEETYVDVGPEAFLVLENVNYEDPVQLEVITNVSNALSARTQVVSPPIYNWVNQFQTFINSNPAFGWNKPCNISLTEHMTFAEKVRFYINIPMSSECCKQYGQCGAQFAQDIIFDEDMNIQTSRMRFAQASLINQSVFISTLVETTQIAEYYGDIIAKVAPPNSTHLPSIFAYSFYYVYFEQYTTIRAIAFQDVIFSAALIYGIALIITNLKAASILMVVISSIMVNVVGLCYLQNLIFETQIMINAVSVVNVLAAGGLAVEFCLHLMIRYIRTTGPKKERITAAFNSMGSTVFIGIFLTKLIGVSILSLATSQIFKVYYFRMYISIVVLGAFYGLLVLPAILMIFGAKKESLRESSDSYQKFNAKITEHSDIAPYSSTQS